MNEQIALVTGANRGIGFEVCRQLADLNYRVFLGSRDLKKGEAAVQALNHPGGKITAIELDVSRDDSVKSAFQKIKQETPVIDVIINNAAIHYDDWENVTNIDLKILREALETNTFGAIRMINTFLPLIIESKRGRIVNVSSELGSLQAMGAGSPAYNMSKVALNALTVMYAEKLRPHNILINSVCPGWTFTDMGKGGRPVPEGAKSVVWAVTIHDDGPTGGFFRDGKPLKW